MKNIFDAMSALRQASYTHVSYYPQDPQHFFYLLLPAPFMSPTVIHLQFLLDHDLALIRQIFIFYISTENPGVL